MEYGKIYYPLITAFNEDIKTNNGPSHITELTIISIKSLIPSETFEKVYIDYIRYNEEIKFWLNYRSGDNPVLLNLFNSPNSNIYWSEKDDTVYSRILPIIVVNKNFSNIKDEVIKNVLFTSGNIETLMEAILISKLLFLLMAQEGDIIEKLKEEIINFSQIEFLNNYGNFYRVPKIEENRNFKISFEQEKIKALSVLNLSDSKGFSILKDCIGVYLLNNEAQTIIGNCIRAIVNKRGEEKLTSNYHKRLIDYLYKLRKSRIAPEALKIENYYLPDVFQFNEGDEFFHSLLNNCRVIKKEKKGDTLVTSLSTKSGIYRCKK